jgi:hypothetical protein
MDTQTPNPWSEFNDEIIINNLNLTNSFGIKYLKRLSTSPVPPDRKDIWDRIIVSLINNTNHAMGTKILSPTYVRRLVEMFVGFGAIIGTEDDSGYYGLPIVSILISGYIDIEKDYKAILDGCRYPLLEPIPKDNMDHILYYIGKYKKIYHIVSERDITSIVESGGEVIIGSCYDYRALLRHCIFPVNSPKDKLLVDYLSGMDDDSLDFWHDEKRDAVESEYMWKYIPFEEAKKNALVSAESLPLILHTSSSPKYVYRSMRPRTDMGTFRTIYNRKVNTSDLKVHSTSPLVFKTQIGVHIWIAIPVTRYAKGMSKGLYYDENEDKDSAKFCGTFYYLEEESSTYLLVQPTRYMVAFNKTDAMMKLGEDVEDASPTILKHIKGELPQDLIMTPQEAASVEGRHIPDTTNLPPTPHYAGAMLLYATEDEYDQPLCVAASKKGIDVIILTHMVGSFKVVSEVLDTRDRKDSFKSLVYND